MSTLTLTLPNPHEAQWIVKRAAKRFNVLTCGRRWGKTVLLEDVLIEPALQGFPVGWFAPGYKYLAEPWRALVSALAPVTRSVSKSDKVIELITGGRIDFWSIDDTADQGRGYKYKRIVADESAKCRHLEQWWTEAGRATLTDYGGDAYFGSTPKGRNYHFRLHNLGLDPEQKDWASWQMPTTTNRTIQGIDEEVEAARQLLPERAFEQEYLAEFLMDGGSVFRKVEQAVDKGRSNGEQRIAVNTYQMGVDLGRKEDFTVLTILDHSGKQVYWERFSEISWERQLQAIIQTAGHYKAEVVVDATGLGDPIYEQLRKAGVSVTPFIFTNSSKESLVDNLAIKIERGGVRLMDIPVQTNELLEFEVEVTKAGNLQYGAPPGCHDDCVIALGLAAWGRARQTMSRVHKPGKAF